MRARRSASARERPERMRSFARLAMWERSSSSMSYSTRERRKSVELMERRELRSFIGHPRYRCKTTGPKSPRVSQKSRYSALHGDGLRESLNEPTARMGAGLWQSGVEPPHSQKTTTKNDSDLQAGYS